MNRFARTKPIVLLTGLVMVILGVAVIINPITAVTTLIRIMGFILIVYGVITLLSAFVKGDPMRNAPSALIFGGICTILGLVMAIWPAVFNGVIWTVLGVIILTTGVMDIIETASFRSVGSPLAVPATVSGVITALLGVAVILAPMASSAVGMILAACALLVDGVTEIIFGLGM